MPFIIEARQLAKRVSNGSGQLDILKDLDFQMEDGASVAIIGRSGAGKTTLLSILAGLDDASSGQLLIDGQAMETLNQDERARWRAGRVGFVFQSFQLLESFTALDNVRLAADLAGLADAEQRARRLLQAVGLEQRLSHYPRQLSGGEKQRVAVARAFVAQPRLLFADEPTGNLDTQTGQRIIELLFQLNQDHGTSLVLVTHDEALARRCDRQLRLDDGRLTADERVA